MTISEISEHYGVSTATIQRYMVGNKIDRTRKVFSPDKHEFETLYLTRTVSGMSEHYGVSSATIKRFMRQNNISRIRKHPAPNTKEWFIDCVDRGVSKTEMAKLCGVDSQSITAWLKAFDIEQSPRYKKILPDIQKMLVDGQPKKEIYTRFPMAESTLTKIIKDNNLHSPAPPIRLNKQEIVDLYLYGFDTVEIEELSGYTNAHVSSCIRAEGIKIRAGLSVQAADVIWNKEKLIDLYDNIGSANGVSLHIGCSRPTVVKNLRSYGVEIQPSYVSSPEYEIAEFLDGLNVQYDQSNRQLITPLELDFYLPEHNIALEYNGLYWHSTAHKKNDYHRTKSRLCKKEGVQLIHIFEDDWIYRKHIVKNMILSKLGKQNTRIFARKCNVVKQDCPEFFDSNHIQGRAPSTVTYTLVYDNSIVAAMSFRLRGGREYELNRYATVCSVVGGASRLLSRFKRDYDSCDNIVSFADLSISDGGMYETLGFDLIKENEHDYKYVIGDTRKHKFGYRKNKFKTDPTLLYEEGLSEFGLADLNGIHRIYDAGKLKFSMVC